MAPKAGRGKGRGGGGKGDKRKKEEKGIYIHICVLRAYSLLCLLAKRLLLLRCMYARAAASRALAIIDAARLVVLDDNIDEHRSSTCMILVSLLGM
jgi:hypothetical protein